MRMFLRQSHADHGRLGGLAAVADQAAGAALAAPSHQENRAGGTKVVVRNGDQPAQSAKNSALQVAVTPAAAGAHKPQRQLKRRLVGQ